MLEQAAAFYDEELGRLADVVTSLVNPVLMLVMGLLIGGVVVLMYMPIFQLVEQLQ
jgi:general secretion pathway protein F